LKEDVKRTGPRRKNKQAFAFPLWAFYLCRTAQAATDTAHEHQEHRDGFISFHLEHQIESLDALCAMQQCCTHVLSKFNQHYWVLRSHCIVY
jgi:hypothetical protein